MSDIDIALKYVENNKEKYISDFKKLISYPTVAAYKSSSEAFSSAAEFIKTMLIEAGADNIQLLSDYGNPVIYAEKKVNSSLPTVLLYAHYDVQPAEPLDLWKTDPYDLVVDGDRMYGRGVSDDKDLVISIIKTLEAINKCGLELKYNIKVLFESSEEAGSKELNAMLDDKNPKSNFYRDLFSTSTLLACDTTMADENHPSITLSCRGCVAFELTVIGPNRDIHSGHFGGVVGNPIHEICRLIGSLHDENNHVTIDGFYDNVDTTEDKKREMDKVIINEDFYKKDLGVDAFKIEKGFTYYQSCRLRPTIEVNGIFGGHIKEGGKTIIPSYATAKLSARLVDDQKPQDILRLFEQHIKTNIDPAFKYKIVCGEDGSVSVTTNTSSPVFNEYKAALREEYGEEPIYIRAGGSIPIMSTFKKVLGCDIVFVGFGGPNSNCHGPNENYSLTSLEKGIKTLIRFLTS